MAFVRTVKTTSKTGESYQYLRIVESYWDRGKRKHRVIANLGNIEVLRKDIKQIVNGLLRRLGEKPLVFVDDLNNTADLEYGVGYVASFMWRELGLEELVKERLKEKKVKLDYGDWIKMMVVNRLSDPRSKLGIFEWLSSVWWPGHGFDEGALETSKEVEEDKKIEIRKREVMKFYRALDYLLEMKKQIETHLYLRFRDLFSMEVDLLFYDLTSSYFEGDGPEGLAQLGYSRDHEPGKPQVVIGLILCNGLPIGHEVFEGSRVDKKTLKEVFSKIKNQYRIRRCIFIGDRGLLSRENLDLLEKDEDYEGFESILALRKRRNREVREIMLGGGPLSYLHLRDDLEYTEVAGREGLRYILCRNPEIAKDQQKRRREDMKKIEESLNRLKLKVDSQRRPSLKRMILQIEEILSCHHGRRLYGYKVDENKRSFEYFKKEEAIRLERELDGVYILRTYEKGLTPEEIIDAYKDLQEVERAFRSLKSPLELRPFFHHREERVRAHVLICVLAYTIEKVVERLLRDRGIEFTGQKVFSLFKQMGVAIMKIREESYAYTSEPTHTQRNILKALKIPPPPRMIIETNRT